MNALVYVVPVHNEEKVLEGNVARLAAYLDGRFPEAAIFLIENGSRDRSWEICQRIAAERPSVRAFREESAGIGYAYHRGLREALDAYGPTPKRWAVLTAADLPFGFTDLEAALSYLDRGGPRILIGSKAHPESQVDTGLKRTVMSAAYRLARFAALGMRVGDSQGSVFLRLDLAGEVVPKIESRNFFYSTELCHFAERAGERIAELPVVLEESVRGSTVRPLKHGREMARQLLELRRRTR